MNGKEFREQRLKIGLSQEKIAKILGISKRQIINIEQSDKDVKQIYADKLSEIFHNINTGNYIKTIQTNNGHIVQGKSIIHGQPTQDPREKTLIDKFRTLSEIGKIEVENCVNNTYLKELKENTDK